MSELDEIQVIFFEECAEGLAAAEAGLTAMQAGDCDAATIAAVFRAVHSIKGGAGAFGHVALTAFAHRFENLMDEVRAGRIPPTPPIIATMLSALDVLSDHVAAAHGNVPIPDDSQMLVALEAALNGEAPAPVSPTANADATQPPQAEAPVAPLDDDPFGFVPVAVEIEAFDAPAADASAAEADDEWAVAYDPSPDSLASGGEPLLVIRELEELGGRVTSVGHDRLPPLRDVDPELSYLGWTLRLPGWAEEARIREAFDFVPPDSKVVIERASAQPVATSAPVRPGDARALLEQVSTSAPAIAAIQASESRASANDAAGQTIRVDLHKLDLLLNLVGELVIRNSILADRLDPKDRERVELPELARLTREIQDNVMSLRAQPIRQAFSRVPRMLRDLTAETGKLVNLVTHGEMTEVDKGVIEKIGDPLTHLIRNAVDHGIESPDERLRAGKPAEGTIVLTAEQKGARIIVTVADDGRGIDRARVRAKAIERGLVAADAQLDDSEIDQLICAPGFSTAATISNISGRGVGMDVVRSNVEALGGRVDIASVPGKGTTFTLVLPLTLAILDGMVVRLSGQRFVLPLATVIEAVRPEPGQVSATMPGCEVIEMRGEYLPIRRLSRLFNLPDVPRGEEPGLCIIIESETAGRVGMMVDAIDDRREVVIKSLEQNLHPIRGLGGATILGDGSIALILDVEALVSTPSTQARTYPKGLAA